MGYKLRELYVQIHYLRNPKFKLIDIKFSKFIFIN